MSDELAERAQKLGYEVIKRRETHDYVVRRLDLAEAFHGSSNANLAGLREMLDRIETLPRWRRKADGLCVNAERTPGTDWELIEHGDLQKQWELKLRARRLLVRLWRPLGGDR